MEQLVLYWPRRPVEEPVWPEGFTCRRFDSSEADVERWISVVRDGLIPNAGPAEFQAHMLEYPDLDPRNIFLVEKDGDCAATITYVVHPDGIGYMHMAGSKSRYRGLGLGNQLTRAALRAMWEAGCKGAYLTTDDFRIPAVKSYLRAGYLPVLYREDMEERWEKVLREAGVPDVPALRADGTVLKTLNPKV